MFWGLAFIALFGSLSHAFFMSGSDSNVYGRHKDSWGFTTDHKIYSHLVIPPWTRPFKIGYCTSWEWNTDRKYRDQRIAICKKFSKGKHECDSESGFCDTKCPFTNGSYPFWRLRNAADVPFLWAISTLQMYETPFSKRPLTTDPHKGYASSYFGPGFTPSNAFDNNEDTLWLSNGAAPPGMQWIGYEFDHPVYVGSVRLAAEADKPERAPSMIYVEASCEKYFKNFVTAWVINNPEREASKRFSVFSNAKFTTLGASGRLGPVGVGRHYSGMDHEGQVSLRKGVQLWKVPATGTYSIEAAGAAGGYDKFSVGANRFRGRGARVKGNFKLKKGELLKILVGQEGTNNPISGGAGGGGGTFILKEDNTPLIVAGGGGGVDKLKGDSPRCHGSINEDGNPGYGGSQFRGGSSGNGAEEGDNGYSGGGGAGLNSNGRNNKNFGGSRGTGGEGGKSFLAGGAGGRSNQNDVEGGFGGGGGPNGAGGGGGGGGGYSGGASGSRSNSCGGGGGSYNAGSDKSQQAGANNGAGYALVSLVSFN
ncbi:uncharacterized PE-PGRS family protein PE_PGRS3 [Nematostella vectensis]|uniref:uncharacterized PE-PGRS family protein PE_PGRS3 n=1 Tax=Nematostella vectensis TaxID=45351 RepID=UPI0013906D59|nr:uncharacterized PE-PGRS family protein PE_PGRS3 [Nematostella vectensis]